MNNWGTSSLQPIGVFFCESVRWCLGSQCEAEDRCQDAVILREMESSGIRPFKFEVALLNTRKTGIQSPWLGKTVYLKTNI